MESALLKIDKKEQSLSLNNSEALKITAVLERLHECLKQAVPLLLDAIDQPDGASIQKSSMSTDEVSSIWLLNLCQTVPSELEPIHMAQAILEAAKQNDETQQQAALFDALGASEAAMDVLMQVAPVLSEILDKITPQLLEKASRQQDGSFAEATTVDLEEERRQLLLREAMDAAQVAAVAKAELEEFNGGGSSSSATHSITRTSEVQARKAAEKAAKRATQALQRAKDAGAILDESDLLTMDRTKLGDGGLMNRTKEDIYSLQQSLLPEGSKQYYDKRGLPRDAIRETDGDIERVIIPASRRTETSLPERLKIADIMDEELGLAFEGTTSLNPMQSAVFDVAFHTRDNMMLCAPTGAGKTNVAMLTVASHFRDVGLIGQDVNNGSIDAGKKVVYIAPMKALAQEVVEKFSSKLKSLDLIVRELTGDMQLTRREAESANVLVTTPEKWDVVTRKSGTDENSLGNQCGLLIIDEVHLLADERGAVIESVVSRLHRLVESRQRQVRIVALSATLPNYDDVATFLQVPDRGVFYFGPEHRPVPLQQTFIGLSVNVKDRRRKEDRLNQVCFDVVLDSLQRGYQVMVFVHSRKGTSDTANALAELAVQEGVLESTFITQGKEGPNGEACKRYSDRVKKSRNKEVGAHFENGMGIHHAGMLRGDRKLTEQMFNDGAIKVLCCTATLAWGINLPAHSVVIKGTEVYNPEKGGIVDLSILDVQQIFGRAGRPQFDSSGEATLITTREPFQRYMDKLVRPVPIESNFIKQLADHLNAEVVGGTVTNLREAARWLTYTYLYVRMQRNPLAYGISADEKADDPMLRGKCMELVTNASRVLDDYKMIRAELKSQNLGVVDNGRIAAHYYIQAESVATFNEMLGEDDRVLSDTDLCRIICSATEFQSMKIRQEEMDELQDIAQKFCPLKIHGAGDDEAGRALITDATDKAFVLLQAYIARARVRSFTLISDMNYIASNASRVARALFEICLKRSMASPSTKLLRIASSIENQYFWFQTPLRYFSSEIKDTRLLDAFESSRATVGYDTFEKALSLLDMQLDEVASVCKCKKSVARDIQRYAGMLPHLLVSCDLKPITSNVVKFKVQLEANFEWHMRWHGGAQSFWLWVEDNDNNKIRHHEHLTLSKRLHTEPLVVEFSVPLFGSSPKQCFIRIISDGWSSVEQLLPVPLDEIKIPNQKTPYTDLLDLTPLPTSALNNPLYEQLYKKFDTFNPIQTQLYHVLYHTDTPVLLGAPTGSGKTLVAEIAIFRMKTLHPKGVCVYIAPLKALARERLKEWQEKLGPSSPLNWKVLELSGDTHHDQGILERADILVCTPEKWDLISRGWRSASRNYVSRVRLLVIDEIHLLGEDRGGVLEAIVSRTRFISSFVEQQRKQMGQKNGGTMDESPIATRIVGLSTALANPTDLADWIGVETNGHGPLVMRGLYNFRPSVRPVPTEVHVQGYPGKHYCPRMATMNKPCFAAIKEFSPTKPSLIFVASRRQTRLTAFDIISYAASDEAPKMFLGCSEMYVESVAERISDEALRHTITFGIGLHHAGLSSFDREIVEKMFLAGEIKVLVATATLAWGVNLPAHLVIVKGTEYYDGKSSRYVDYPLTDVLQMIGRAGRPGFDTKAEAVVMVAQDKKNFYKRFLYTPFPVESCLEQRINENLNAEISSGTISTVVDAVGYLTWTFFARRVKANPTYYGAASGSAEDVESRLLQIVMKSLGELRESGCVELSTDDDTAGIISTELGNACCQYYLSYRTPKQFQVGIREACKIITGELDNDKTDKSLSSTAGSALDLQPFTRSLRLDELLIAWILFSLCSTHEFDELPVRHNEEYLNEELSDDLMWGPDTADLMSGNASERHYRNTEIFQDPHTKCFLLVQAYLEHAKLPISDYVNDTKSVTENLPRLLAAMAYIAASETTAKNSFEVLTQFSRTRQVLEARCRVDDHPMLQLPHVNTEVIKRLDKGQKKKKNDSVTSLLQLRLLPRSSAEVNLQRAIQGEKKHSIEQTINKLYSLPLVKLTEAVISIEVDKVSGKSLGKLKISMEIEREKLKSNRPNSDLDSYTITILVGSFQQRFLLAKDSLRIARTGCWTVEKDISFDWTVANADGGKDGGRVILRLLFEEIRGLDTETILQLK